MQLEQLVLKFQQKDSASFEKLYGMYSESMHGVIYNIVRNKEEAEEVLQDVFVKAWEKSDSYSSKKGRFFTWLINISRNAAIDKVRSKDYTKNKKNLDVTFFVDIIETSDNLDSKLDAIGIKKFVGVLKDKCKSLIELLYFKGYTQKEASEELKIPLGTVKTNNRNCIAELRNIVLN
tara:strand:- start:480241 stop:480771 length:531 start_codon:yes stop_codon:yes gene_type:complete